ncbi:MAG: hypothetical protein EOO89_02665 [Pedobacter sp.]|nr:MAG: hypothetical protein EOO89_02665 [Pedobacter sp.]
MDVIFTTCTYNHIGRAFSLADSVIKNCRDTKLVIGLVDGVDINIDTPVACEIVNAHDLGLPFLKEMFTKYSILELNSALKPYFADHILKTTSEIDQVIYLDSDILLYNEIVPAVKEMLINYSVVISPHALSSAADESHFNDRNFLRSGIYNAGFFAVKKDVHGFAFLDWWMDKLKDHSFIDAKKGMFAEQLWLNLAPLYLNKVYVVKDAGYNVAYWNLHERTIELTGNGYVVNGTSLLMFFHFSGAGLNCIQENTLSVHPTRYTFTSRPDVLPLFEDYIAGLKKHSFEQYNAYTTIAKNFKTRSPVLIKVAGAYKKIIKRLLYTK